MRLTCPNCGAQYEVPDDVIPEEGRDVQCSNCGDTWFQQAAGFAPGFEAASEEPTDAPSEKAPQPQTATASANPSGNPDDGLTDPADFDHADPDAHEAEVEFVSSSDQGAAEFFEKTMPAPTQAAEAAQESDNHETEEQPLVEPAPPAPSAPQSPRGLDPALSDILREEAEREASLRAADNSQSQSLETQPNLGLDDLPENEETRRSRQAKDRMARIRGEDPRRLATEASGLKRGVLPDIEEINSTLRAADSPTPPPVSDPMAPPPRKSGFTRGFALAILAVLALVMVYSNASQIAEILPQTDPYLSNYVTWVDHMRLWLDSQVSALQGPQL